MNRTGLLVSDFVLSFMRVWAGVLIKIFVGRKLGLDHEILKAAFSILNSFLFAFLARITNGGAYNPLHVLVPAISGDFANFIYCISARIPVQVSFLLLLL
ncbi:hypothetical protein L6164_009258 [Bauhinia variegata]|uniref:Uncharacterized protein n=1 Tax=Bauhinia variegata TaxID=167791 RepID=A0ACB9PJD0_BAUVA|nr:hypothetical protein L6164_009258 [Bauhinia variegata]